jgi:hypothetical protein
VFGIVANDFDADGDIDLAIAQSFYTPQRETTRMSGGLGVVLIGSGYGTCSEIWPAKRRIHRPRTQSAP